MNVQEKNYRSVVNRLGVAMLVLFGGIAVYQAAATEILPWVLSFLPAVTASIVGELVLALLYSAAFLVPIFLFYGISRGKPHASFDAAPHLPRGTLLYVLAALAAVGVAAYLNTAIVNLFEQISVFENKAAEPVASAPRAGYQLVLAFITTAIVPAFVEEALFRGVVLKNLLPYGRTTAVFVSALLFGIMHQNAAQFFYATVAGLVIGYIFVHVRSIWVCVLIHFCNNAFSVLIGILHERMSLEQAVLAETIAYFALILLGTVAAFFLLRLQRDREADLLQNGCFERDVAPDAEYAAIPLPMARRVRLLFTPPMVIFFALCAVQILYMLGMAVLF